MEKVSETFLNNGKNLKKILIGSAISIVITIISLIAFACILTYTDISENTIPTVTIMIAGISILIGSIISTTNLKKNGLINGALIGSIYIVSIYLLSSIIEKNFSLNIHSIIMIIICIITGIFGGIIGVNKK